MSEKRLAAMQPYWLPHKGFFDLIAESDIFVFMDSLENASRSWLKSNYFVIHGATRKISIPLLKHSSSEPINLLTIHNDHKPAGLMRNFKDSYRKAQNWDNVSDILSRALGNPGESVSDNSIQAIESICKLEGISPQFFSLSDFGSGFTQMGRDERIIALCKKLGATTYINNLSGAELYNSSKFQNEGISLEFFDNEAKEKQPLSYLHHLMHKN